MAQTDLVWKIITDAFTLQFSVKKDERSKEYLEEVKFTSKINLRWF